jgi:hypothetical protein
VIYDDFVYAITRHLSPSTAIDSHLLEGLWWIAQQLRERS